MLSNVTLVGNGSDTQGVRLRAGTQVELYNAIVTGKGKCITTETAETDTALKNGTSKLEYIAMSTELVPKDGTYTNADFEAAEGNSTDYVNTLTNNYVGTIDGGKTLTDSFFEAGEPFPPTPTGPRAGRVEAPHRRMRMQGDPLFGGGSPFSLPGLRPAGDEKGRCGTRNSGKRSYLCTNTQ